MKHEAFRCLLCLMIFFASPLVVSAAEQPRSYTDSDLQKYRNPADSNRNAVSSPREKAASGRNLSDRQDQEKASWCKEGTKRSRMVEQAKHRVSTSEAAVAKKQEEADRKPGDRNAAKRLSDARKKLAKDQEALAREDAELASLETRAYRKGVPPGWLKCNTEF